MRREVHESHRPGKLRCGHVGDGLRRLVCYPSKTTGYVHTPDSQWQSRVKCALQDGWCGWSRADMNTFGRDDVNTLLGQLIPGNPADRSTLKASLWKLLLAPGIPPLQYWLFAPELHWQSRGKRVLQRGVYPGSQHVVSTPLGRWLEQLGMCVTRLTLAPLPVRYTPCAYGVPYKEEIPTLPVHIRW